MKFAARSIVGSAPGYEFGRWPLPEAPMPSRTVRNRSLFAFYEPGENPYFSPAFVGAGDSEAFQEIRHTEALYDEAARNSF